jgi:RNA polymerase sigma factor (sigma-70 family)
MGDADSEERHRRVLEVEPVVRRVICARIADSTLAEDLIQDTMVRLLQARSDLSAGALVGYAVASARNSVVSHQRRQQRRERLEPKVVDADMPVDPEAAAIADQEQQAVRDALHALDVDERRWLLAHDVDQVPISDLAHQAGTAPGALAARLARARAKLRVEYLLTLRRIHLPTPRCKPVLLALSAGDRRRQESLGAGSHLVSCRPCAALSQPLVSRRRGLAALWPFPTLELVRRAVQRVRDHPVQSAAGGAMAAVAVAAAVLVAGGEDERPPPVCEASVQLDGRPVSLSDGRALAAMASSAVQAPALVVHAVPANEGFWAGCGSSRVWVQLEETSESPFSIQPGQRVALQGVIRLNPPNFTGTVGVSAQEGAAELDRQGFHLQVRQDQVRLI